MQKLTYIFQKTLKVGTKKEKIQLIPFPHESSSSSETSVSNFVYVLKYINVTCGTDTFRR
jgi:hypothetical protein